MPLITVVGPLASALAALVSMSCKGLAPQDVPTAGAVASVTVLPADAVVEVGASAQLSVVVRDASGDELTDWTVTWATSAGTVAAVSGDGMVTGQAAGAATITATAGGVSGSTEVTVVESAECSSSLSDVSLPLCDGTYTQSITSSTFPRNAVIRARTPGNVRFTGSFRSGSDLTFRGIVIVNNGETMLGAGGLYEDMSFVGGPACYNQVNTGAGSGVTIRRSAFYGKGGRYQLLIYEESGITLEDVIFRSDGGWGEGGHDCDQWEPNAVLNDYDSSDFTCIGCILFDGITTAATSELLGGLGVNCHNNTSNMTFENSLIVNSQGGFYSEGHGACNNVVIRNSASWQSKFGYNRNVSGSTQLINFSSDRGCGNWKGSTTLEDSKVAGQIDGCSGSANGQGASLTLNGAFLDNPRWRREMCDEAGVTRGWCGTTLTLSEYLLSF